jgi:hypothetical protein
MFSKDKYFTLNDECSRFLSNDGNFLPDLKVPYSATGMQKFSKNLAAISKLKVPEG